MSLHWPIFSVASNKSFWTDYYWFISSPFAEGYTELVNHRVPVTEEEAKQLRQYNIERSTWDYCRLDVPLGQYVMYLQFDPDIGEVNLSICDHEGNSFQLGWDDCAHWHPHVLRWEELDLICKYVACLDARLPHPGIPLLLFCRFAPITDSEDAEWMLSLLRSAWQSLGLFTEPEIDKFIGKVDCRGSSFEWVLDSQHRWILLQEKDLQDLRMLYTLRSPDNPKFPFEQFAAALEAARRIYAKTKSDQEGRRKA